MSQRPVLAGWQSRFLAQGTKVSSQNILSAGASGHAIVSPWSLGGVTLCLIRGHAPLEKRLGKAGAWQAGVPKTL